MTLLVLSCCDSFYSGVQPAIFAEILVQVNGRCYHMQINGKGPQAQKDHRSSHSVFCMKYPDKRTRKLLLLAYREISSFQSVFYS